MPVFVQNVLFQTKEKTSLHGLHTQEEVKRKAACRPGLQRDALSPPGVAGPRDHGSLRWPGLCEERALGGRKAPAHPADAASRPVRGPARIASLS